VIVVRLVSVIHSSSAVVCLWGNAELSAFAKEMLADGSRFVGNSYLGITSRLPVTRPEFGPPHLSRECYCLIASAMR
jgi:hypothetical protein